MKECFEQCTGQERKAMHENVTGELEGKLDELP
jgi:hypothetical protein